MIDDGAALSVMGNHEFNAIASKQDMSETYLYAFTDLRLAPLRMVLFVVGTLGSAALTAGLAFLISLSPI